MNRRERILAEKEGRRPRKLNDSDDLLGVCDAMRMGGIRFKSDTEGVFLSDEQETAAPPWATLRTLEYAARHFENEASGLAEKWLNQLIQPGSSLGGARPKATVVDPDGQFWIARFPSRHDEYDAGAWEKIVHDLAGLCGLNIPESKLEKFSKLGSTFLAKRFDRLGDHSPGPLEAVGLAVRLIPRSDRSHAPGFQRLRRLVSPKHRRPVGLSSGILPGRTPAFCQAEQNMLS